VLYANPEKCVFGIYHIEFLGFVVSSQGMQVDEQKVATIKNWPTPQCSQTLNSYEDREGAKRL